MNRLLKCLLSLIAIACVSSAFAQTTPTYRIEMKNKFHSKHHRDQLWGVQYPNDEAANVSGKDVREFPYVEKEYKYDKTVSGYKAPDWSETNDSWRFVKQFAVSKGVIYWMKPTESVINYWNTVTGEVGAYQPNDLDGNPLTLVNQIGYGSITHDWKGNLVFAYYTAQDQAVQGFGTLEGRNTAYGNVIDKNIPVKLTWMNAASQNCSMSWIQKPYMSYEDAVAAGLEWEPNPNIPMTNINSLTSTPTGTEVVTHYLTASDDIYDIHWGGSSVFSGYSGGNVFITYNNIVFANLFADGKYANWYLNYKIQYSPTGEKGLDSNGKIDDDNAVYKTPTPTGYLTEGVYRECDVLEYFWSAPGYAYGEFGHPGGDFLNSGHQYDLLGNLNQYYAYSDGTLDYLPEYTLDGTNIALTQTGYDWTAGMESDSIKGHRVLVNSSWMNRVPNQYIGSPYNTYVRDGSFDVRSCAYTGGYDADGVNSKDGTPNQWPGEPTRTYTKVATGYGYNNEKCTAPLPGIAVNCWNELERVNNNVLALYTHVPGQGFSKYFITAVEQNNPVTLHEIERVCYNSSKKESDPDYVKLGGVKVKLSWTAQEHDRETLNRYEVWYKTYKRDAEGNLVSDCGDNWKKAGVASIDYSDGNYAENRQGVFYHELTYGGANTEDTSDDYDLTYEYMIIPIYDASDHRGTEAIYSQKVPSAAPRYPATATLSQVTEGEGSSMKYSFNLKLDVTAHQNMSIPYSEALVNDPSVPHYWVAIDADSDEERNTIANALRNATSLIAVDENGNELTDVTVTVQDNETTNITANNCYHYPVKGYNVWVQHGNSRVSYGGANKFPSLMWKNVDPNISYKVKVYCNALREYNFIGSPRAEETMVIPGASTAMVSANFMALDGDYKGMAGDNDILPMGAKLKSGSNEVTNPVILSAANTLGTRGSVINPLAVTDEVLTNWNVQYTYHVLQNEIDVLTTTLDASDVNAALYSNSTKVIVDVLGLPIAKTDWNIHNEMALSDAQKAANDNITKQGYDATTTQANVFKTKVDVSYTRKTNSVTASNTNGTESTITMPTESPFLALKVNNANEVSALFRRTGTHWDENCTVNGGYFKYYYDAGIQWSWEDYDDNLNKYIGYHAVTQTECAGHYETSASTTWTQYYAANILSDYSVSEYNKTLTGSNITGFLLGIEYDGTENTDWSALATSKRTLPMNIHYVWGGQEWVTTDVEKQAIKMNVILTADYPIIEGIALKINEFVADQNYSMVSNAVSTADPESTPTITKSMITVPTTFNNFTATHAPIVTGVEGIITEACGGVKLYPNPVESAFTLRAPMALGEVRIFSMDGQLVKVMKDINDTSAEINVDDLPQGMYIVNTLGTSQIMIKL